MNLYLGLTILLAVSCNEVRCHPTSVEGQTDTITKGSAEQGLPQDGELVIVLPHDVQQGAEVAGTPRRVQEGVKLLHKKEGLVKGMLVNKNLGGKYFSLKRHQANKAVGMKHLSKPTKMSQKVVDKSSIPKSRQKRFIFGSLRNIAVPLTIFHYLGFMPMRVPGLPYHIDPGLPDYTVYEPYNDLSYPEEPLYSRSRLERRRHYKTKY